MEIYKLMSKYININFPFKNSPKGFFLDLNDEPNGAIKADLLHLILTQKGQRLYLPEFGTDLLKYIFEPNDLKTLNDIKTDVTAVVKKFLPNLQIKNFLVEPSVESEYAAVITIEYTITDDVFETNDVVVVKV
jgi:phage baseplate assembly protein W